MKIQLLLYGHLSKTWKISLLFCVIPSAVNNGFILRLLRWWKNLVFTVNFLEFLYHVTFKLFFDCFLELQYMAMNLKITSEMFEWACQRWLKPLIFSHCFCASNIANQTFYFHNLGCKNTVVTTKIKAVSLMLLSTCFCIFSI